MDESAYHHICDALFGEIESLMDDARRQMATYRQIFSLFARLSFAVCGDDCLYALHRGVGAAFAFVDETAFGWRIAAGGIVPLRYLHIFDVCHCFCHRHFYPIAAPISAAGWI